MSRSFPPEWWRVAAPEVWLPTASEVAELDRIATASGAIPERALIENAGRAAALLIQGRFPEGRVLTVAGSGHNGADALVAGRTLRAWGRQVEFLRCGSRAPEPDVLTGWGLDVQGADELDAALSRADLVIDGIFGTGLETAPREAQARMIQRINESRVGVTSMDGPSGVDFTSGAAPGEAILADMTVTFGWPKLGLLQFPARRLCGDLVCVEIGFPPPEPRPAGRAITAAWAAELLGERRADAHKGQAGYLTLLGGQPGMAGAVVLAAEAAIRAGVGIVRVVSAPANREIVQTGVPDAVFVSWEDESEVRAAMEWAHAVAIGPGLGAAPERRELVEGALSAAERPSVMDADGLNLWGGDLAALESFSGRRMLLTPHPGEAARLLGTGVGDVRRAPTEAARRLARETGSAVLLKGAPTWVATPDGALRATTLLAAAFGTGGACDVLTGVCGAYLAAGLAPADAATAALMVTGLATVCDLDEIGGAASDIPFAIPSARAALSQLSPGAWAGVTCAFPAVASELPLQERPVPGDLE